LIDGICTLANVVIADPTQVDLVSHATPSSRVAMTVTIQTKEGLYYDQHPKDMFFPLAIEVFGCIHQ
jgi:hypothetical protein